MFSLIGARKNGWVNNREAGDLRCRRAHYDVTVMQQQVMGHVRLFLRLIPNCDAEFLNIEIYSHWPQKATFQGRMEWKVVTL